MKFDAARWTGTVHRVRTFVDPLFNRRLIFGTDVGALRAEIWRRYNVRFEVDPDNEGETHEVADRAVALYVSPRHRSKRAFLITLAHEANHAARAALRVAGEDSAGEETEVRYQDWILHKILPRDIDDI